MTGQQVSTGGAIPPIVPVVRYSHDCSNCVSLGQFNQYDLYCCKCISTSRYGRETSSVTLVARYSDYGPDYISDSTSRLSNSDAILEAKKRAIALGYL